ncbi:hypothetical protein [Butyrivibrio sp. YAB3001]|uniref:hypothetical protein n=1 Tax=Butyrivibrio sp. YAB3001 TaxID=1520812 RepID=UPI0008F65642|nr:hypothetical protein [Butyrivibrio sp. YAB3001]SFB69715.1 hypothetical protein SAMN02910398_00298 [Butyrivibrio sp. YAB3001]
MSTDFFSSLNGKFDYTTSLTNILSDYNQIKSGAYGSLMKAYVNKVGNKEALNAYRETGSTATGYESEDVTTKKSSVTHKSNFLDSVGRPTTETKKDTASTDTSTTTDTAKVSTDKYAKLKSSWLDDQLKQYDKDATATTAADTSISYDTTV